MVLAENGGIDVDSGLPWFTCHIAPSTENILYRGIQRTARSQVTAQSKCGSWWSRFALKPKDHRGLTVMGRMIALDFRIRLEICHYIILYHIISLLLWLVLCPNFCWLPSRKLTMGFSMDFPWKRPAGAESIPSAGVEIPPGQE